MKCTIDLNVRVKAVKLLGEVSDCELGKYLKNMVQKLHNVKMQIICTSRILKHFSFQKILIRKSIRKPETRKKIVKNMGHRGIVSRIYKELLKVNSRKKKSGQIEEAYYFQHH